MESKNASFPIYSESYIVGKKTLKEQEVSQTALGLNPGSSASSAIYSVSFWHVDYHIVLKLCLHPPLYSHYISQNLLNLRYDHWELEVQRWIRTAEITKNKKSNNASLEWHKQEVE